MARAIILQSSASGVTSEDLTAKASEVLAGKTAVTSDSNDVAITGTMTNRGAVSQTLNAGGSYTIPAGYHNGSGKVTANSLSSQTSGTAGTLDILDGRTAWVNGTKIEGTMPNRGNQVASTSRVVGNNNVYFRMNPGYYYSSGGSSGIDVSDESYKPEVYATYAQIASLGGLTAAKLAKNQTVFGVAGSYTSDANAVAGNILTGKTAYVNGSKLTGSMANQGAKTASLNCGASYTIPAGYHNGSGKVTANSLSSQTSGTATAADIVSGKTAWVNGSKITGTNAFKVGKINKTYNYSTTITSGSSSYNAYIPLSEIGNYKSYIVKLAYTNYTGATRYDVFLVHKSRTNYIENQFAIRATGIYTKVYNDTVDIIWRDGDTSIQFNFDLSYTYHELSDKSVKIAITILYGLDFNFIYPFNI